jgi:hypothetical protein
MYRQVAEAPLLISTIIDTGTLMLIPDHNYTGREQTVCRLLEQLVHAHSLLNIGMRNPSDPRNHWWLKICKANRIEPHVLEIYQPNCLDLESHGVPNVTCGDVRDINQIFPRPFDIILWWHGPEHVEGREARRIFNDLIPLANIGLILGCPLGDEPQGVCYGNLHERHLSAWHPSDFELLGFDTATVNDRSDYGHITAWRMVHR